MCTVCDSPLVQSGTWSNVHGLTTPFPLPHVSVSAPQTRRAALEAYWQQVIAIEMVTDFHTHHCSEALKTFLNVEEKMAAKREEPVSRVAQRCTRVL